MDDFPNKLKPRKFWNCQQEHNKLNVRVHGFLGEKRNCHARSPDIILVFAIAGLHSKGNDVVPWVMFKPL